MTGTSRQSTRTAPRFTLDRPLAAAAVLLAVTAVAEPSVVLPAGILAYAAAGLMVATALRRPSTQDTGEEGLAASAGRLI